MPGKRATSLFNSFSVKVVVFVVRFIVSITQTDKIFNLSCTLFHALRDLKSTMIDDLKPLFLISNFHIGTIIHRHHTLIPYVCNVFQERLHATTNNDTTSTNKKRGKNDLIWSHRNNTILYFNKGGCDISFLFFFFCLF